MSKRDEIDEIMQFLVEETDKSIDQIRKETNKLVYDFAERNNMSVYDVCLTTRPEIIWDAPKCPYREVGKMWLIPLSDEQRYTITLKPYNYDEIWRDRYFALKEKIKELINYEDL